MIHYRFLLIIYLFFCSVSAACLISVSPAAADILFTIKPSFAATWRVDDNFYKAQENERKVYTYLYEPGIELGVETEKSHILLDYTMNIFEYDDRDNPAPGNGKNEAEDQDYVGHTAVLDAKTKPFERLTIGLDEAFYFTRDPARSDRFNNTIDREKYHINRLTPVVYYEFNPIFTFGLRYRHTEIDYDPRTREDSDENRWLFNLAYHFNEKTALDLEYQHWEKDYQMTTSDYTSRQIKLSFMKQFNYFYIEGGAGYHNREFEDPGLEDIDTYIYRVEITGQNPPAPEEYVKSYISFISEWNFNDQTAGDNYYEAHRLTLEAGHLFWDKIAVNVDAYYQKSDYERTFGVTRDGTLDRRKDHAYLVSGKIGYWFTDWLLLSLEGGYERRNSNIDGLDFDNTYWLARVDFKFNLGTGKSDNRYYKF